MDASGYQAFDSLGCCVFTQISGKRYSEEWSSHIEQSPGKIAKIAEGVGFVIAALVIVWREKKRAHSRPAKRLLEIAPQGLSAAVRIKVKVIPFVIGDLVVIAHK